jgi:biopolymer transport protein ExbD
MNFRPGPVGAEEPRIEIAPLIDVIFLLLLFFVLTTTFATQRTLDVALPEAGAADPLPDDGALVVALQADGRIRHEGTFVSLDDLSERLAAAAREDPERTLELHADQDVPHGRVVAVMDAARRAGLFRVAIAADAAAPGERSP